ncbi:lysylphosphatidylglycerol synthase transmembrane domain-containing protein [Ruminococcus sp. FC2018]|uniref:lysylphosphatidylglycerol synthase transmembrane domain-containing protein n=1 Tax=Ruminococcus sp. FC2018 TaxID=1410617 RepID=UPI000A5A9CFB|nr:lysylphosphatidylglycerol synthase transmembrane domain-containing protein [Ruminococcus sp. FC2018]
MITINKKVKYTLNVLFIAVVGYLTFRILFNNKELSEVMSELHRADKLWLILGCVCTFCFIAGESVIIKYMLWLFKEKTPFRRCLKYSFIGFFYSYITPSSSGGQPAQMIYMKKDGIYYGYSSLIMLVIAVVYKAVLVLLGLFFYIFYHGYVTEHVGGYMWLVYVGFFLNLAYITLLLIVCLKPLWSRKMAIKLINFLTRIHVLNKKNTEGYIKRVTRIFDNYVKASKYIGGNMGSLFTITWITVLQRLSLFMLTWVIYKSYGLHGASFMQIVALQVLIGVAVEMLPLPGAAGITEACFIAFFTGVFADELLSPAILLNRGISFYAVIIVGGLVTLFTHLLNIKKYGKSTDKAEDAAQAEIAVPDQVQVVKEQKNKE